MGLIEDYKSSLLRISMLKKEIPVLQKSMTQEKEKIAEYNADIASLQLKSEQRLDTLMRKRLVELTDQEYDTLTRQQQDISTEITSLTTKLEQEKQRVLNCKYENKLKRSYALSRKLEAALASITIPEAVPPEISAVVSKTLAETNQVYTERRLLTLINNLHEMQSMAVDDELLKQEDTFGTKVLDFISFKSINDSAMSNRNKFYLSMAYAIGMVLGSIFIPGLPIGLLSTGICLSYKRYTKTNKQLLKLIMPYSRLQDGAKYLKRQIEQKIASMHASEIAALEAEYSAAVTPLQKTLEDIKYAMSTSESRVRAKMSNQELKKSVQEQFKLQEEELHAKIEAADKANSRYRKELQIDMKELAELQEKAAKMIPQIKELYLNPTEPGTSPNLVKSFLISVDEEHGKLDEFDYGGNATFIMYKGASSAVNSPLITMMLMQFIANMSLANLKIYLTDIQSAGMNYAPFCGCVKIASSTQEVKKLYEDMNIELIQRRDTIAAKEENIEVFNQKRLDNHGLAVPYILLLLQDMTLKEMQDEAVIQLVATGAQVGIIPIIFVSHSYINNAQQVSQADMANLERFFAAFIYQSENKTVANTFIFDGLRGSLNSEPKLIDTVLNHLRKVT